MSIAKRTWMFYEIATGKFLERTFSSKNADDVKDNLRNLPKGYGAIEGRYDPLTQRVTTKIGVHPETDEQIEIIEVENFIPESPGDGYQWHEALRRHVPTAEFQAKQALDRSARAELAQIDVKLVRPLAEKIFGGSLDPKGQQIVDELLSRKAVLQNQLIPQADLNIKNDEVSGRRTPE